MQTKITITNINNIDFSENKVIENSKVEKRIFDSYLDSFLFENINTNKQRKDCLMNVSLFDDLIVIEKEKYKILAMLSKKHF
jgi:hypothetical protein